MTKLYRELHEGGGQDGRPLSARTVEYVHALLRKAFNDAVQIERLLSSNPVERAKRPRRELSAPSRVWSPAQLTAFLEEAREHRLYAFFHLAAHTGARRGELLNLRWSDIDLDQGEITITGSAAVIAGERVEGTTKAGRGRTISLDAGTVQVLRQHRGQQVAERLIVGTDWLGGDYVFTTGFGAPIYPSTVTQLMPKLIAAHNQKTPSEPLPPARLHDLRHIHATTLLLAGVPVHVVAVRLGHADPSITLRVYAHVLREDAGGVADVFAQAILRPREAVTTTLPIANLIAPAGPTETTTQAG